MQLTLSLFQQLHSSLFFLMFDFICNASLDFTKNQRKTSNMCADKNKRLVQSPYTIHTHNILTLDNN